MTFAYLYLFLTASTVGSVTAFEEDSDQEPNDSYFVREQAENEAQKHLDHLIPMSKPHSVNPDLFNRPMSTCLGLEKGCKLKSLDVLTNLGSKKRIGGKHNGLLSKVGLHNAASIERLNAKLKKNIAMLNKKKSQMIPFPDGPSINTAEHDAHDRDTFDDFYVGGFAKEPLRDEPSHQDDEYDEMIYMDAGHQHDENTDIQDDERYSGI